MFIVLLLITKSVSIIFPCIWSLNIILRVKLEEKQHMIYSFNKYLLRVYCVQTCILALGIHWQVKVSKDIEMIKPTDIIQSGKWHSRVSTGYFRALIRPYYLLWETQSRTSLQEGKDISSKS